MSSNITIISNNLDQEFADYVKADLDATLRLAQREQRPVPHRSLRLLALDRPRDGAIIPRHSLRVSAPDAPPTLAARCDWQKQRDSFQLLLEDDEIWVIGGSGGGVMYGVNEALSCLTGIIWAYQDQEKALFGPTRTIPDTPQVPRFAYRGIYSGNSEWFARQRLNFRMMGAASRTNKAVSGETIEVDTARGIQPTLSEHAMHTFIPSEVLVENPEWMGMRDGQRTLKAPITLPDVPHLNAMMDIQPCYSNPAARKFIINRMAVLIRAAPGLNFFGIWPHDGVNNWCQCPECLRKSPFEHMHTLAQELQKELPQAPILDILAYSNMLNLPLNPLPPGGDMYAFFCPYLRSFQHHVYDSGGPEQPLTGVNYPQPDRINPVDEREYGKIFENWLPYWRDAGITPALFEYEGDFPDETGRMDHQRYLHVVPAQLREDEAIWYAECGVEVALRCGQPKEWPDSFPELAWAAASWGNEPIAALRHRYYSAIGGEHGDSLADAIDSVAAALKNSHDIPTAELDKLTEVLDLLPASTQTDSYRDWIGYIALGRQVWQRMRAGKPAEAAALEPGIRAYISARAERIPEADFLLARSHHYERRAREIATGKSGDNYVL